MNPLVSIRGLDVTFRRPKNFPWSRSHEVRAVIGVDLDIAEHETVGLVGESGSGKTTTGRASCTWSPSRLGPSPWVTIVSRRSDVVPPSCSAGRCRRCSRIRSRH